MKTRRYMAAYVWSLCESLGTGMVYNVKPWMFTALLPAN